MEAVEALAALVCEPGSSTTEGMVLRELLQEAASTGPALFALFAHPASELRATVGQGSSSWWQVLSSWHNITSCQSSWQVSHRA
jgi:hypothetical protein